MVHGKVARLLRPGLRPRLVPFNGRRNLSHTIAQSVDEKLVIIPDSLEETLSRQRAINRHGVVRKIVPRAARNPEISVIAQESSEETVNAEDAANPGSIIRLFPARRSEEPVRKPGSTHNIYRPDIVFGLNTPPKQDTRRSSERGKNLLSYIGDLSLPPERTHPDKPPRAPLVYYTGARQNPSPQRDGPGLRNNSSSYLEDPSLPPEDTSPNGPQKSLIRYHTGAPPPQPDARELLMVGRALLERGRELLEMGSNSSHPGDSFLPPEHTPPDSTQTAPLRYYKKDRRARRPIWLEYLDSTATDADALSFLDAELRAMDQYLCPTEREESAIERIKNATVEVITGVLGPSTVPILSGSRYTGLAKADSSLDLLIPIPDPVGVPELDRKPSPTRPKVLNKYRRTLSDVLEALEYSSEFAHPRVEASNNPIITTHHKASGLLLRIYCAPQRPTALEYAKSYLVEFPELRPLYFAIRMILEDKACFGGSRGSLTPYGLQILIVSALKGSTNERPDALGQQLLDILHMYSSNFNCRTTGVSVDPPRMFDVSTMREAERQAQKDGEIAPHIRGQRSLLQVKMTAAARGNEPVANHLCIQDPTNYLTDVGWSCTRTHALQRAFSEARSELMTRLAATSDGDADGRPQSLLLPMVPSFATIEERRRQLG